MNDTVVLVQYRPAFGIQALLRILQVDFKVENTIVPFSAASGDFPQLRHRGNLIAKDGIIKYILSTFNANIGYNLTSEQEAVTSMIEKLIHGDLKSCLEFSRYEDEEHYHRSTKQDLIATTPFPLHLVLPFYLRKTTLARLSFLGLNKENVIEKMNSALLCLARFLGTKKFFFNDQPSLADALLFGFMAESLYEPVVNLILENKNNMCLIEHFHHMRELFFDGKVLFADRENLFRESRLPSSQNVRMVHTKSLRLKESEKLAAPPEESEEEESAKFRLFPGSVKFIVGGLVGFAAYTMASIDLEIVDY